MDRNAQIQEILNKKLTWRELTPEQQALFENQEEFESLISVFQTGAVVDAALLEDLVNQMNQELDLKNSLPDYSTDQQALIEKLLKIRIEQIRLEQIQENKRALEQIKPEIDKLDTKQNPRQELIKIAHQTIGSSNQAAVEKFIAVCLASDLDLSKPQDLDLAVSIALGENKLYEEISQAVTPATNTDANIDISKIPPPDQVIIPPAVKITPALSDTCDTLSAEVKKLKAIEDNPQAQKISYAFITQVSSQQLNQIAQVADLQLPTQSGQKAAAILKQFPNQILSPSVVKLYSQGLTYQQWTKIYQKTSVSPRQAYQIHQQLKSLDNSQLSREITQPLSKTARSFQTLTNKFSSRLPQRIAKPLNHILHPVQSIKGWFGKQVGRRIGVKIYKAFAGRIKNKTARLVAKTLLREGVKKGAALLVKLGIKAGLIAGGVTAPIALVMVAWDAIKFVGKKIIGGIQNIAQSIWGEKIKARDLLALPAMAAAGIGSILTALSAATVSAAGSAAAVIAVSAAAGVFIYITAFAVAPLISTIAHLEMEPFYSYNFTGSPGIPGSPAAPGSPGGPPYTPPTPIGPLPPGCPSGWPVISGSITQGPKSSATHYSLEAVDFGPGTGSPIFATHPGRAIAGGSPSNAYGYYVDVYGICQGVTFATRYAHMPSIPFYSERLVAAGEQIGVVNNTGNSTGPHLHYDIRGGALGDINQFLPTPVKRGCVGTAECAQSIP